MTKSLQTDDVGLLCATFGFSLAGAAFRGYEAPTHHKVAWSVFLANGGFIDTEGRLYFAPRTLPRYTAQAVLARAR